MYKANEQLLTLAGSDLVLKLATSKNAKINYPQNNF
jgi:hypothetical protein